MLGVYDLNLLIKESIINSLPDTISIIAEISSFKEYDSVIYITLKDIDSYRQSTISGCIWKNKSIIDSSIIKVSAKVKIDGTINMFIKNGTYQMNIYNMELDQTLKQENDLKILKEYYEKLGYFKNDSKKPITKVDNICIITAKGGAALQDILHVFKINNYSGSIVVINSLVQGSRCVKSVVSALQIAENNNYDLILITRGGGSKEDLFEFNDKTLVEEIYKMKTPIMTAIGHEIDISLSDYVADAQMSTPTRAAEVISNIFHEKSRVYANKLLSLKNKIMNLISNEKYKLECLRNSFDKPQDLLIKRSKEWDEQVNKLKNLIILRILDEKSKISVIQNKAKSYAVNKYPFVVIFCETDGTFILSKEEYTHKMSIGHKMSIFFRDGIFQFK